MVVARTDRRPAGLRSGLLLVAAALAGPALARTVPVAPDSALHGYVLGRYASVDDELLKAARYFDAARKNDPSQPTLARRAFELAVAAGERDRAFALAQQLALTTRNDPDVQLMRMGDALLRHDWKGAAAARSGIAEAGYAQVVGPIVDAWIAFGKGDVDGGLGRLDPSGYTGFARAYIVEQRAHMLAAAGRWTEAAGLYGELRANSGPGISLMRAGEADALAMAGQREAALALLADDPGNAGARQKLLAGKRIGALAPDPRRAVAWMSARLASDLSRDRPVPLALMFGRLATFLAPDLSATWLICGDVLARGNQRESALEAYGRVPADDGLADAARGRRAEMLEQLGRSEDAGAMLKAATVGDGADVADWVRLGDWHRRADRFEDAARAYGAAIARAQRGGSAGADGWTLWFLRGSMLERAGRWPEAEADLRAALQRAPEEPVVLNYLGYSLLDRGEKLAEAGGLIERAARLRPGDGGIVDSLGWSQYRQGRYAEAVDTLEKAWALEQSDPTVIDHLGDAYWQVGRRIEARFRWRQALDLDPDARQAKALRGKLDYGLDAALAMAAKP